MEILQKKFIPAMEKMTAPLSYPHVWRQTQTEVVYVNVTTLVQIRKHKNRFTLILCFSVFQLFTSYYFLYDSNSPSFK